MRSFVEREPSHVMLPGLRVWLGRVFGEAVRWHEAPVLGLEPHAAVRRRHVSNVHQRMSAYARRWRYADRIVTRFFVKS